MPYPGRVIKTGEQDNAIVQAIAAKLATFGYSPPTTGRYDENFAALVKLFQSHHSDAFGRPLKIDGKVGPLTWGALFSAAPSPAHGGSLGTAALEVAVSQLGVMEQPPGSNTGPVVNQYLASVHCAPGSFWCMAFVNWCFVKAAHDKSMANPWPDDASCVSVWDIVNRTAKAHVLPRSAAVADPGRVLPGMVFIHDYGGGHGHTGFVEINSGGALKTVEGNADPMGGSNGLEVLRVNRRSVMDAALKGFIAY